MEGMLTSCHAITSIPHLDTSNVTTMSDMVRETGITTIPLFNTSKVKKMGAMFYDCHKLTTVPKFDTSNVTDMTYMFVNCSKLTSIPQFDVSKVTNMYYMLKGCTSLEQIHMVNIGTNLDISASTIFTREALLEVIGNLVTLTSGSRSLTMGATNIAKLTDEDKAIATNKGSTLA